MIYALYSTDYELFLGENYRPEKEVLIDTTEELLRTCERIKVPLNIFCDVACLWRYRELGREDFPRLVEDQLKDAVQRGHDVQTHLHPHWLYATSEGKGWKFPDKKFLLGRLEDDPQACRKKAVEVLSQALTYLQSVLKLTQPSYQCLAYRAGGYGLQPNDRMVLAALVEAGYRIDSSIVPGLVYRTLLNEIDFSRSPRESRYWLSGRYGLSQAAPEGEGVFEIPILACKLKPFDFLRHLKGYLLQRYGFDREGVALRGQGAQVMQEHSPSRMKSLQASLKRRLSILWNRWTSLEDQTDSDVMFALARTYLDQFGEQGDVYFSLNIHSKTLSSSVLNALVGYHERMRAHYGRAYRAITFQEAASTLSPRKMEPELPATLGGKYGIS